MNKTEPFSDLDPADAEQLLRVDRTSTLNELRGILRFAQGRIGDAMGCLTWLVSDAKKEYCDLGKVYLDAEVVSSAWMEAHPDWRYLTEVDDEFDDVYLAEDEEDAREYLEEFPDFATPIYKKTGNVWKKA